LSDSADSESCEPAHGCGGADDDDDDEPLVLAPELPAVDDAGGWEVCCDVDGRALELCGGRGEVFEPVPAAAPDGLSEARTLTVSTTSTITASTEAPKANRRRQ
jgi:hypothetical protein